MQLALKLQYQRWLNHQQPLRWQDKQEYLSKMMLCLFPDRILARLPKLVPLVAVKIQKLQVPALRILAPVCLLSSIVENSNFRIRYPRCQSCYCYTIKENCNRNIYTFDTHTVLRSSR